MTTRPHRIQRQRTKGWRMPEGAVYVGRPTKWGNPYWDVERYGLDLCLRAFENTAHGIWNPSIVEGWGQTEFIQRLWLKWLYEDHCRWMKRFNGRHPAEEIRIELRGKDLACWCPPLEKCHADILLEIANGG